MAVGEPSGSVRWMRWGLEALRDALRVVWPIQRGPEARWPVRVGTKLALVLVAAAGIYALVVVVTASSLVINDAGRMVGGLALVILLPYVLGVALAAIHPLDGWRLVTLWLLVTPFLVPPPEGTVPPLEPWQWCLWVPVLLAAAWALPGTATVGLGLASGLAVLALTFLTPWPVHGPYLGVALLGAAIPLLVGTSLGARMDAGRALAQEQARASAARAESTALAERARIAREMHDIIGHHLSLIAVRCETAPYRLTGLDERAQAELAEVAAAARGAMTDLQRLLGVLRSDDDPPARDPQPGQHDLTRLLTAARQAGVDVAWEVDRAELPDALGLTVYRVVQQGLANARQHAAGAPVRVVIRRDSQAGWLHVWISNGPGRSLHAQGAGTGLIGMRERVEMHGGRFQAGPTSDGGFAIQATLPCDFAAQP